MADAPFMYWVGVNTVPGTSPEELAKFDDFYTNVHMREVVQMNPGFIRATRYELVGPDPRGNYGPKWLAMYEMEDQAAADYYIKRNDGGADRPKYTPGPDAFKNMEGWWRLIWNRFVPRAGELGGDAAYLNFIAMNVQPGTAQKGFDQFNNFYSYTHIPEVVASGGWMRGTRYELYREMRHPEPGSPRFLAVYEGDENTEERRKARAAAPPGSGTKLSSGPPPWEAHDTLWRLLYKRCSTWAK